MDPGSLRVKPLSSAKLLGKDTGAEPAAGERQRVVCVLCGVVGPAKFIMGDGDVRVRCLTCSGEWSLTEPAKLSDDEFEEATRPGEGLDGGALARRGAELGVAVRGDGGRPPATAPSRAPAGPSSSRTPAGGGTSLGGTGELDAIEAGVDGEVDQCPKCRTRVDGRSSCPACGLARHRFAHFNAERNRKAAPELDGLWRAVTAAWDQPAVHKAFLERAVELGQFAPAAARYRAVLDRRKDDPVAVAQLERLRRIVQVLMLNERPTQVAAAPSPFARSGKLLAVVLVVGAVLVGYLLYSRSRTEPGLEGEAVPVVDDGSQPGRDLEPSFAERKQRLQEFKAGQKRVRPGGATGAGETATGDEGEAAAGEGDGEAAEGDEGEAAAGEGDGEAAEPAVGEKIPFPSDEPTPAPP